jgi:hypothetical protein
MMNAVANIAYSTGNRVMGIVEWITHPLKGKSTCEYARIQRLKNSMIRLKQSPVKGQIMASFLAMSIIGMQGTHGCGHGREVSFDSDMHVVSIDNRCSACISPDP